MAATRTKLDPQGLYRCVEPFSFGGDDGVPIALNRETVLLGNHEYVRKFPHLFGVEGDPEDQAHTRAALVDPVEEAKNRNQARWTGVSIMETKYRVKRAVRVDVDGELRKVRKGELVDPSELIVSLVPGAFQRVSFEHQH